MMELLMSGWMFVQGMIYQIPLFGLSLGEVMQMPPVDFASHVYYNVPIWELLSTITLWFVAFRLLNRLQKRLNQYNTRQIDEQLVFLKRIREAIEEYLKERQAEKHAEAGMKKVSIEIGKD